MESRQKLKMNSVLFVSRSVYWPSHRWSLPMLFISSHLHLSSIPPSFPPALHYLLLTQRLTSADNNIESFLSWPHFFLIWNNIAWPLVLIPVDCALVSTPSSLCCYVKKSFPTIDDTVSLSLAAIRLALMGPPLLKPGIDCAAVDFDRSRRSLRRCGCRKLASFLEFKIRVS